jgi:hypothetical protein
MPDLAHPAYRRVISVGDFEAIEAPRPTTRGTLGLEETIPRPPGNSGISSVCSTQSLSL